MVGSIVQKKTSDPIMEEFTAETELTREDFKELLRKIDAGLRGLPATAQVRSASSQLSPSHQQWSCDAETAVLPVTAVWVCSLLCLPLLGCPAYYAFGNAASMLQHSM